MISSRIDESEPVLNLRKLFYDTKEIENINATTELVPNKGKYDNFKLLTDIQNVLKKCSHLSDKDRLNYCNTQRYFMKLYLREMNKSK